MATPRKTFIFQIDDATRAKLEQLAILRSIMTGKKSGCCKVIIDQIHTDWEIAARKGYIDKTTGQIRISKPISPEKT